MKTDKIYKAGTYRRLSREDGDNLESESIVNQTILLKHFLQTTKEQIMFVEEYTDDGYSGGNFNRPGWQKLMHDIEIGKIDTIVTKDLSRMGRDYIAMGEYIERKFPEKGIRYIAINDDIDTLYETPGLEMLQFKLMFNDYYIKETSKKIRKIMKSKKEGGQYTGWKGVYGYKRSMEDKHKLVVDENVRPIIKRMFNLVLKGKNPSEIAHIFSSDGIPTPSVYANLSRNNKPYCQYWSSSTIKQMLKNPTYVGSLVQGIRKKINYKSKKEIRTPKEEWIIVENAHEAIIDKSEFDKVQSLLNKKNYKKRSNNRQLLSGFLVCKECGHSIGILKSKDAKRYYCHCNYYTKNSKYGLCTPHTCNYLKLESVILDNIRTIFKQYINIDEMAKTLEKTNEKCDIKIQLEKEICRINNKIENNLNYIDRAYEDKICGHINIQMYLRIYQKYQSEIEKYEKEKDKLEEKMAKLDKNKTKWSHKKFLDYVNRILFLEKPSSQLIASLIDKVVISEDKKVEIFYKFRLD